MDTWRLIDLDTNDGPLNMAIDEAVAKSLREGNGTRTIRLYRWKPSCVSIGYFQSIHEEVNLKVCQRLKVDVVRRITGGGAVYHDYNGEITYSIIVPEKDPKIPRDIQESYRFFCQGLIRGLAVLGVNGRFKPINDINVGGIKISGNAQTRRGGIVIQHGTLLVDLDVATMFSVLNVSKAKISDKMIKSIEERVTSLKRVISRPPDFRVVADVLIKGFEESLGIRLHAGSLSTKEVRDAEEIRSSKYATKEWTYRR